MAICIYCQENEPPDEFNAEHVIPRQLGTFADNFVLADEVCRACNDYFGRKLEIVFGRDTHEALRRYTHGLKSAREADEFVGRRVEFRIPPGTPWEGARLRLAAGTNGSGLVMQLIPQIGIRRELERLFRFFSEEEFREADDETLDVRQESKFRVLAPDGETLDRLNALVRSRVPKFRIDDHLPPPPITNGGLDVEMIGTIDRIVARTVAKIAFNYASYQIGHAFVLDANFDPIRRFIRYDEGEWRSFVHVDGHPLLADETPHYRRTRGHLIVLEWKASTQWAVRARVSPFNELTYTIVLSAHGPDLWQPIDQGHHFDWQSREISRLTMIPSSLLLHA